jgi:hypothetical protein
VASQPEGSGSTADVLGRGGFDRVDSAEDPSKFASYLRWLAQHPEIRERKASAMQLLRLAPGLSFAEREDIAPRVERV